MLLSMVSMGILATDQPLLTLSSAIELAVERDLWVKSNHNEQRSIEAQSIAAGSFPDPKISLGVANVSAENFNFNQEPMTQLRIGLSQAFPRGKSRQLKKQKLQDIAAIFPYQRQDRLMQLVVVVSHIYLDAYKAQESIALINKDRELFEQLVDVVEVNYTSSIGKTRQHDIIRSQLELIRLDDRLTVITQQKDESLKKLNQWISEDFTRQSLSTLSSSMQNDQVLSSVFPNVLLDLDSSQFNSDSKPFVEYLLNHPRIKSLDQKLTAAHTAIELAKQQYKPEFSVTSSYGFRNDNPLGVNRADLFSIGVTFDVPLFTKNKQDQQLKSEVLTSEVVETEKLLMMRAMKADFEKNKIRFNGLKKRQKLYENQLLPQMREQATASLTAYKNDDGDFSEVVRSRIAVLNAEIDELEINTEILKTIIQLNYFLNTRYQDIFDINTFDGEKK